MGKVTNKVANILDSKNKVTDDYFKDYKKPVTRGELQQVLQQVLGGADTQLEACYNSVVKTSNLVDVVVQALIETGLLNKSDLAKAKDTVVEVVKKNMKEGNKDVK